MSARWSTTPESMACSGGMYSAVPTTVPVCVSDRFAAGSFRRASPRSATFTTPSASRRMFPGLTSRWTIPWAWAYSSPRAAWRMRSIASAAGSGPRSATSDARSRPVTSSITRNGPTSASSAS